MSTSRHPVVEVAYSDRRECRTCGREVIGHRETLRHLGEAVRIVTPEPEDSRIFSRAVAIGQSVSRTLPPGATDAEVAAAVIGALYSSGLLRRRQGPRRGEVVEAPEGEREPDVAERASLSHV